MKTKISKVENKIDAKTAELLDLINNFESNNGSKLEKQRQLLIVLVVIGIINVVLHFL